MERVTQNLIEEIGSLKEVVDKNNTDAATLFGLIDNLITAYNAKESLEADRINKIQELEQLQSQLETALTGIGVNSDASSDVREAAGVAADGTIIEKITNLKDDLSAQAKINATTMSRLATAQQELQQANADLQNKEASILDLDKAATDKQAAIESLTEQIETLKQLNSEEIARLEQEKAGAIAEKDADRERAIQKEKQEKTQLQEKFDVLQNDFQTKSADLVQLQTQIDEQKLELEARIKAAETKAAQDLENAETENARQIAQATAEAAEKAGELQEQIETKAREIDALQSAKGNCDAEIESLKTQLKIARETVTAQVAELNRMRVGVGEINRKRDKKIQELNMMQQLGGRKKKYTRKGKKKSIKKRTRKHVKKMKKRASHAKNKAKKRTKRKQLVKKRKLTKRYKQVGGDYVDNNFIFFLKQKPQEKHTLKVEYETGENLAITKYALYNYNDKLIRQSENTIIIHSDLPGEPETIFDKMMAGLGVLSSINFSKLIQINRDNWADFLRDMGWRSRLDTHQQKKKADGKGQKETMTLEELNAERKRRQAEEIAKMSNDDSDSDYDSD